MYRIIDVPSTGAFTGQAADVSQEMVAGQSTVRVNAILRNRGDAHVVGDPTPPFGARGLT